jgi:hypothetical protein
MLPKPPTIERTVLTFAEPSNQNLELYRPDLRWYNLCWVIA